MREFDVKVVTTSGIVMGSAAYQAKDQCECLVSIMEWLKNNGVKARKVTVMPKKD